VDRSRRRMRGHIVRRRRERCEAEEAQRGLEEGGAVAAALSNAVNIGIGRK
jgi:hypothetical protein